MRNGKMKQHGKEQIVFGMRSYIPIGIYIYVYNKYNQI